MKESGLAMAAADEHTYLVYSKNSGVNVFLIVNLTAVIGVNVAFMYFVLIKNSKSLLVAQMVLSLLKLAWNSVGVPNLIDGLEKHIALNAQRSELLRVQLFIGLFNNITIPLLSGGSGELQLAAFGDICSRRTL